MSVFNLEQNDVLDEWSELNDQTLVARAKTSKEAFGALYQRYVERIYNYIYYRTGNVEDAEDLTARTFQRAMKHLPNYKDQGVPFTAWLYRIARNLVANHHRDTGRRTMIALDDIEHWHVGESSPERLIQAIENEDELLAAIRRLPRDRQELLLLKFLDRMSNSDIGAILGRSEGAVKSLYHRTLLVLREELAPDDEDVSGDSELAEGTETDRFKRFKFWRRNAEESK